MEKIRAYFEKAVNLSDEDWKVFSAGLKQREFPKRTQLTKTGETENYLSYLEKGVVRFYIPQIENDIAFGFVFEGSWVSAYDSFLTRAPAKYNIECLTDCTLWSISYEDIQIAYANTRVGEKIGRVACEELFLKKAKRELSLLNSTAEQRYLKLLTEQQHLVQQIPLKFLASYIGVTPQALSRIRKRIS